MVLYNYKEIMALLGTVLIAGSGWFLWYELTKINQNWGIIIIIPLLFTIFFSSVLFKQTRYILKEE